MNDQQAKTLSLAELAEQRRKTDLMSKLLRDQLTAYLETLRPVFAPERFLGRFAGGKSDVSASEQSLAELQRHYAALPRRPYELPPEFDPHWLTLTGTVVELQVIDYVHEAKSVRETRSVTVTSPLRWILAYKSNCSSSDVSKSFSGASRLRPEQVRQFVVNALILNLVVTKSPGLAQLFAGLRYHLNATTLPSFPQLPVVTITSSIPSGLPSDDLILAATSFSGVPAFVELVDLDQLATMEDPVKAQLLKAVE